MDKIFYDRLSNEIIKFRKKQVITINDEENFVFSTNNNQLKINNDYSETIRKNLIQSYLKSSIEIPQISISPSLTPILLEESYIRKNYEEVKISNENSFTSIGEEQLLNDSFDDSQEIALKGNIKALHLVVLVHGFQGNSFDMRLIKYNLSLLNSTLVFLSSTANQDDTETDFLTMGKRLANEVKNFIKEWNDGVMIKRISFIGHSIGGIIIRACLPHLKEFSNKMFLYCSLSSPHLGYMYSSSTLIDAGMWVLKKLKQCKSLDQLSLSDSKDLYESGLYKLSESIGFEWFEHIYLVSGHQDYYAPFESTRIQLCNKSSGKDSKGQFYRQMANNLLGKLTKNSLKRIDVNFVISER